MTFDSEGVCEYCRNFAPRKLLGRDALLKAITRNKQPGSKYDCVAALSGGRDSTFTLYYLVKVLGLKVVAFTVDHAFLPRETVENIQTTVRLLGVEHEFYRHDSSVKAAGPMLRAWLRRPDPAMVSSVCLGCRMQILHTFRASAEKYRAACIIGAGEPGNDEYFGARFFTRRSGQLSGKLGMMLGYGRKLAENPWYVLNTTIPRMLTREYLEMFGPRFIKGSHKGKILMLFHYIPWDERQIMDTIVNELGWKRYKISESAWRSDCKLAVLKNQMYLEVLGFTKNDILVSAMVREGTLTREEAIRRLERENQKRPEIISELCTEIAGVPVDQKWKFA